MAAPVRPSLSQLLAERFAQSQYSHLKAAPKDRAVDGGNGVAAAPTGTTNIIGHSVLTFLQKLLWLDGNPIVFEPYRLQIFHEFFDLELAPKVPKYSLALCGRAKKNAKTLDLVLAATWAVMMDDVRGSQVFILANDEGQAKDDLDLLKKLIDANPQMLEPFLEQYKNTIKRKDGKGTIEVLPANDIKGAHGKSYRLACFDEIHGYKNWDLFEALAPDPHRSDAQRWITSYASIYHRPGVPLFDLYGTGRASTDPRMLFSWYAADFTTDPDFDGEGITPEVRANPSMVSWGNSHYLKEEQRQLPPHKYRRLHLNLPGTPEGSAYQPEPVMSAVERSVATRPPEPGVDYYAFVDMSGGMSDEAVLAIAHRDSAGRGVLDLITNQGPPPPFNPNHAVARFIDVLRKYGLRRVTGDAYAGQAYAVQFEAAGIRYVQSTRTKHEMYEDFEPELNQEKITLLDAPRLEQQLLGLIWRGGKIDHQKNEHDDWANAGVGALLVALKGESDVHVTWGRGL